MEESRERHRSFQEFIDLDRSLTIQEAIDKLSEFHGTSAKNVLDAFLNLRKFSQNNEKDEGKIIFKKSKNSGYDCIVMEGLDKNGKWVWDQLIDLYSGEPVMHCS